MASMRARRMSATVWVTKSAEVWTGPHGHCCKKCNSVDGQKTESAVDGMDADFSAVRRGQAPQPRSGAPKAQGLTMMHMPGTQSPSRLIAISSNTVRQLEYRFLHLRQGRIREAL
jgi:hypothetical protein